MGVGLNADPTWWESTRPHPYTHVIPDRKENRPVADLHPATEAILRHFRWNHLPEHLQAVSRPVGELAHEMASTLPQGPELTTGLRKLLEAKDCLVRAALDA